ncbi:MAG: hypothetical protein MZV65_28465 [Chromatiales bacterium]|nr:hypothetical protein [Chromatiales bacterium]
MPQSHKSVRILAQSRIDESPTNVCLLMTGNNLTLLGDLARRSLVCTLEAGVERPELRAFARDAIEHVQRFRSRGDSLGADDLQGLSRRRLSAGRGRALWLVRGLGIAWFDGR